MKNFKKTLSAALAILMIMSALALGTSAKSFDDVPSDYKYAEQINIISDIGVTKGTGDTEYSPEAKVTREQMALLLYRLMVGNENSGRVNTTPFTDLTDDTYFGAISWAYANGYILGTSDTTFSPREGITLQDAMTMLVRVLGHETAGMAKGYPWTYINTAVKLDLDIELDGISYTKNLTRGECAAILYNALTAEYIIPKTSINGSTLFETTTIIEKIFGYTLKEATIAATNDFASGNASVVVKDGYVTLSYEDEGEKFITVRYADLGLDGDANDNLGKRVKVVYSLDASKNVKVLGATEISREIIKNDGISVYENKDNGKFEYVEIDGTRYQVVKTLSDELSTNANELLVYAYSNTNKLVQIESNEALHNALGIYEARVIFDSKNNETANRIILKPYGFGKLEISDRGEYNIAGGYKASELKGGFDNAAKANDGEYVLYYFNKANLSLEIISTVPVSDAETVNRITDTTVRIGGKTYTLGNEALGISAESLKRELNIGDKVRAVVVNGMLLAIETGEITGSASNYLIALSEARPVFTNGEFGYAVKVNIDGETLQIFSDTDTVTAGKAYRYTVDSKDRYTLIPYIIDGGDIVTGNDQFVQNNSSRSEIAVIIENALNATITNNKTNFVLNDGDNAGVSSQSSFTGDIKFVTGANTVIVIREDDGKGGYNFKTKKGHFDGNIHIADGAYVAAIFDNEIGSVESLRYLYISDGDFDSSASSANAVKVLENIGIEYVDGKVYTIYNTLNLDTSEVKHLYSANNSLTLGANYKLNNDGTISSVLAEIGSGIITGYTSTTVTIGANTYALANNLKIYEIDEEFDVTSLKLASAYMKNVEFILDDGEVIAIIVLGDAPMSCEYSDGIINVTCDFDFTGISSVEFKSLRLNGTNLEVSDFDFDRDAKTIKITPTEELAAGEYTLTVTLNNTSNVTKFIVK